MYIKLPLSIHDNLVFTITDKFANGKLVAIKAADIDICGEENEIIEQIDEVLAFN